MSKGILLSQNHGLNPTIPVCFWCGQEKNEIALMGRIGNPRMGEDLQAPMRAVIDFEPCEECRKKMESGFTVMEATMQPNYASSVEMQTGVYPTGRYVVLRMEAARKVFTDLEDGVTKAFLEDKVFVQMFRA